MMMYRHWGFTQPTMTNDADIITATNDLSRFPILHYYYCPIYENNTEIFLLYINTRGGHGCDFSGGEIECADSKGLYRGYQGINQLSYQ